jgi:hypothetical protein
MSKERKVITYNKLNNDIQQQVDLWLLHLYIDESLFQFIY